MKFLMGLLLLALVGCGDRTETIQSAPVADGTSCYAETRVDGNYVVCGDSEFKVENGDKGDKGDKGDAGADGKDGEDGSFDGYFDVVELCLEKSGPYIETLLYLDGKYLAFLSSSNWKNQRLVILSEGISYNSTDGRNISFKISGSDILYLTNGCATYSPGQ